MKQTIDGSGHFGVVGADVKYESTPRVYKVNPRIKGTYGSVRALRRKRCGWNLSVDEIDRRTWRNTSVTGGPNLKKIVNTLGIGVGTYLVKKRGNGVGVAKTFVGNGIKGCDVLPRSWGSAIHDPVAIQRGEEHDVHTAPAREQKRCECYVWPSPRLVKSAITNIRSTFNPCQ